jgi:ankyrin repeat protein
VLHLLDLYGADLTSGAGKYNNTPLMAALQKWNVRIIDYLLERKVDPTI